MNCQDAPKTSSLFVVMTLDQIMTFTQVIECLDVLQLIALRARLYLIHVSIIQYLMAK
jgi:hypothetical protein